MATSSTRALDLGRILDEEIDWRYKGFPAGPPVPIRAVGDQGWNVLGGDFMLPIMVLKDSALRHNLKEMAEYCDARGISLAPHGKTHMSPQLLQSQLDAGAWGVTVANTSQARVYRAFGADRILLANELVEPASIRWVAGELKRDPSFELYCLVDSLAGVARLDRALAASGLTRRLNVFLEVGLAGGRAGCRTPEQALEVARTVAGSRHLALAGVEAFEGIIHKETQAATLEAVDAFFAQMRQVITDLDAAGLFANTEEVILTAGGSAFPDRAAEGLGGPWRLSRPARVVLRSGCYITHDAGHYTRLSPFGSRLPNTQPLREALEIWGVVLSRPEPTLALVGFGKRDVSFDMEMPTPRWVKSGGDAIRRLEGEASVFALNDQHGYLRLDLNEELKAGDLVGCGISHPCIAFDKWRLIPVVDDAYDVLDAVLTYF